MGSVHTASVKEGFSNLRGEREGETIYDTRKNVNHAFGFLSHVEETDPYCRLLRSEKSVLGVLKSCNVMSALPTLL